MSLMTWPTFFFWSAAALTAVFLYRAWIEWRRAGRTRSVESALVLALLLSGILLRGAPDVVRYTQSAVTGLVVLALAWRDRKTFSGREPMIWLGGACVALIVILEIDHDFYRFLSHDAQRGLLVLMVAVTAAFIVTPIVQITRLTMEARRVIAEARTMVSEAKARHEEQARRGE
jgi:hypothetical protein